VAEIDNCHSLVFEESSFTSIQVYLPCYFIWMNDFACHIKWKT